MDLTTLTPCHVIYVNAEVRKPRLVHRPPDENCLPNGILPGSDSEPAPPDIAPLVQAFGEGMLHLSLVCTLFNRELTGRIVYICGSGSDCTNKLVELHDSALSDLKPTVVLIDTPLEDFTVHLQVDKRPPSPSPGSSDHEAHTPEEEVYGVRLLERIISEASLRTLNDLVVPISLISTKKASHTHLTNGREKEAARTSISCQTKSDQLIQQNLMRQCLNMGAVDVIVGPLTSSCITTVGVCAYRAHVDALNNHQVHLEAKNGRKRSWVGVPEGKPYAYLREAMVSRLMKHICKSGEDGERLANVRVMVSADRRAVIKAAVGQWGFCAHDFNDDELIYAAKVMFKHALSMSELEAWRIPPGEFLASRA